MTVKNKIREQIDYLPTKQFGISIEKSKTGKIYVPV